MSTPPHILIVKTGGGTASLGIGENEEWFASNLRTAGATCEVAVAYQEPLPPSAGFDGIVVTGSPWMVTDVATRERTWAMSEYLLAADVPVFAVCYGHQAIAHTQGGRVELNRKGAESGTGEVHLTDERLADPLFAGLPRTFLVQQFHPELSVPQFRTLIESGRSWRDAQAPGLTDQILATIRPAPHAERLIGNWMEQVVRPRLAAARAVA